MSVRKHITLKMYVLEFYTFQKIQNQQIMSESILKVIALEVSSITNDVNEMIEYYGSYDSILSYRN